MSTAAAAMARKTNRRTHERVAETLVHCARTLNEAKTISAVGCALAEQAVSILEADISAVVLENNGGFETIALVSSSSLGDEHRFHFEDASALAHLTSSLSAKGGGAHFGPLDLLSSGLHLPSGELYGAALPLTRGGGALFVWRPTTMNGEEFSLFSAIASLGGLAASNTSLFESTAQQAHELQQLLRICSELDHANNLDDFLKTFVVLSSRFLNFERAFIALTDANGCMRMRCASKSGEARPLRFELGEEITAWTRDYQEPFFTDDVDRTPELRFPFVSQLAIRQYLAVPLRAGDHVIGLLALADREKESRITSEDVRRARALAAEVAVALVNARNQERAERQRMRTELLVRMALEMSSSLNPMELFHNFARSAAEMLQAPHALLALAQMGELRVVHSLHLEMDHATRTRLNSVLNEHMRSASAADIQTDPASAVLGEGLANDLAVAHMTTIRLNARDGELLGLLCAFDPGVGLDSETIKLMQAVQSHGASALEHSRLFTRTQQASKQWAELFDSISDLIVVHDAHANILRANRALAETVGARPALLPGRRVSAVFGAANDRPCPFCGLDHEHLVPGKDVIESEFVHAATQRIFLVSTSRVHGALGEGLQTIHVLRDVTERRTAEQRYRELFDGIQEGAYFTTPDGTFVDANDALVRMFGYESREELLSADIPRDLYLAPEQRKLHLDALNSEGSLTNIQQTLKKKDGSMIHVLENCFAVRDTRGKIVQYRGVLLDITQMRKVQAQLKREHDFNRQILRNTQSLIIVADTAGLVSYANRQPGSDDSIPARSLVGARFLELIAESDRLTVAAAFERALKGDQTDNLEVAVAFGERTAGRYSLSLSPMRDDAGEINSVVVVLTDVTDAALLQAKLAHTEKMAAVGQLVSGVAHEVNNPLTAILGFADLMLCNPIIEETSKQQLEFIVTEAERTKEIVQNLLRFARQAPARRERVSVNDVVRRTVALRTYDIDNRNIKLNLSLDEELPRVSGDAHQLQQVFLNILNNAYDAVCEAGRAGELAILSRKMRGNVEIEFRDNGTGLKNKDRIFDPFYTSKEVGKGTGLGLSICYGIIREHGGDISCDNNKNGVGARFTIRLPYETVQ